MKCRIFYIGRFSAIKKRKEILSHAITQMNPEVIMLGKTISLETFPISQMRYLKSSKALKQKVDNVSRGWERGWKVVHGKSSTTKKLSEIWFIIR